MYISRNLATNEKGHLTLAGVDTIDLAKQYGTPLYVMDEAKIRENMKQFTSSMQKHYDGNGLVCYASKALSCKEMYRIAQSEGLGVDVVSAGELYTAMSVDFPAGKICYHGNNKTETELRMAVEYGVGFIVLDNLDEMDLLQNVCDALDRDVTALLRVTPGVEAHTHEFIKTGQIDSKFGLAIDLGLAEEGIRKAASKSRINLAGIHCHIGSQIFDIEPFELAGSILIKFIAEMNRKYDMEMNTMNLGGGFGIAYLPQDNPVAYAEYMERVSGSIRKQAAKYGMDVPFIIIEPGRSIVGPAGITLYTIGGVKEIPGIRKYVSVDGGMNDNIRYALYQAEYDFIIANKADEEKNDTVTVAGRCCESGDLLGEHVSLQKAENGDILAVCATGAYNYAMANHYNRVPKPPIVMLRDGAARVIVRRESLDDLLACDL